MTARIERLQPGEGERWRRIRLQALADAPYAFGTTYAQASQWTAERWQAQVVELTTFVAVVEGHDVGVVRGAPQQSADARELISMWVAPEWRRTGIGAQLITAVVDWAKAANAGALLLDVVTANAPAIALYERAGFIRCDDQASESDEDEIRLVRRL